MQNLLKSPLSVKIIIIIIIIIIILKLKIRNASLYGNETWAMKEQDKSRMSEEKIFTGRMAKYTSQSSCVIPVVRVRTLGSVGSQTQLSLGCNFSDYVLRNNYMFRPMVAIFRLSWE
jgi:hypothetical protein